jgi:hypothetical protein
MYAGLVAECSRTVENLEYGAKGSQLNQGYRQPLINIEGPKLAKKTLPVSIVLFFDMLVVVLTQIAKFDTYFFHVDHYAPNHALGDGQKGLFIIDIMAYSEWILICETPYGRHSWWGNR